MGRGTPQYPHAKLAAERANTHRLSSLSGDLYHDPWALFRDTARSMLAWAFLTKLLLVGLALLGLISLIGFSFYLGAMRIFQVDECCNVFIAHMVALGNADAHGGATLFQYLLSFVLTGASRSIDLLVQGRSVMVILFWVNIFLLALATGEKLASSRGLVALICAATLAPLWDYGFELRHDNLLLTGLLLTWCLLRVHPRGVGSYVAAGGLGVLMVFVAVKAPVYIVPLTLGLLVFPSKEISLPRWKLALGWLAGGLIAFVLLKLTYGRAGLMESYSTGIGAAAGASTKTARFAPWWVLDRLLTQTPLLVALAGAAFVALLSSIRFGGKRPFLRAPLLPEAGLVGLAMLALWANPTPYPYNLVNFVPFLFLFAYRFASDMIPKVWKIREARVALVTVLVFAHFVPFQVATGRHLDMTNERQDGLMSLAEVVTDPAKDPVYDGVRMVATRPIVDPQSFPHGTSVHRFYDGTGPTLREMLAANPPAVLINSYRLSWLPKEEHDFISSRYVPLADDFRVLGKVLPAGGGEMEIVHPGRYRVASLGASDLAGTYPQGRAGMIRNEDGPEFAAAINGEPLASAVLELESGLHHVVCAGDIQPTVVWVGPSLERLPRLEDKSHLELFVNWY